ncbi:hypothetical protein E3N88_32175 [Mikania micrantha]|uniref:Uncharacterized protein n=1 Tax=Mikania micrantha TaxID=192012 RepID=A0A5N6M890_9ASTR|nr:hypothetical protein E3N88_32175 [Mikania micrantha]
MKKINTEELKNLEDKLEIYGKKFVVFQGGVPVSGSASTIQQSDLIPDYIEDVEDTLRPESTDDKGFSISRASVLANYVFENRKPLLPEHGQANSSDKGARSLSQTEWEDRRMKGLCARWGQQFEPTPKCSVGKLLKIQNSMFDYQSATKQPQPKLLISPLSLPKLPTPPLPTKHLSSITESVNITTTLPDLEPDHATIEWLIKGCNHPLKEANWKDIDLYFRTEAIFRWVYDTGQQGRITRSGQTQLLLSVGKACCCGVEGINSKFKEVVKCSKNVGGGGVDAETSL